MIIIQKHLKICGNLVYWRDEPALDVNDDIADFNTLNAIADLLKTKKSKKKTSKNGNNGTKNVEIARALRYLTYFWRTLEMLLINCDINLHLNRSKKRNF